MSLIDVKLKELINEEARNWEEGEKRVFCFSYSELGFKDEPTEDELDQVGTELKYIKSTHNFRNDQTVLNHFLQSNFLIVIHLFGISVSR